MKKTLFLIIAAVCINTLLTAQVSIKAGNTLVYKINDYEGPIEQTVTLETIQPDIKISWNKKNKYDDKGTMIFKNQAKESAINIVFNFPISSKDDELVDVLMGFIVSKKSFNELKANKKTKIRTDCQLKTEELVYKDIQPMNILIAGKKQTVNCVNASWGNFGDEMWILDNADMPIIVKVSALSKFDLAEIK